MNRRPDDPSDPDPAVDQFEAIVAGLRREGAVPSWPADDRPPPEQPPRTPPLPMAPVPPVEVHLEAEHYVPPEPPPLPRIGPPALVGGALLVLGLVLVSRPALVGVPDVYGLPLGLLSLAAGLGWLVLRMWPGPPDELDEDDDGAQL